MPHRLRTRAAAGALTLLLHILPFVAIVQPLQVLPAESPPPPSAPEHLYQAGALNLYTNPGNASLATGLACARHSYIGIGVMLGFGDYRVIAVGDNTPAMRAGLRAGDLIVNGDVLDREHATEGTIHHLILSRDGVQFPVRVVVGRICND